MSPAPFERSNEVRVIQIYIPSPQDRLDFHDIAKNYGTTVSALGRRLILEFIDRYRDEAERNNTNSARPPNS